MKRLMIVLTLVLLIAPMNANNASAISFEEAAFFASKNNLTLLKDKFVDAEGIIDTFYIGVAYLVNNNSIHGVEKNGEYYFLPKDYLTRAQAAKILASILKLEKKAAINYVDTKNHWATEDIQKVVAAGIMKGVSTTRFDPN